MTDPTRCTPPVQTMKHLSAQRAEHFCKAAGIPLTQANLKALRWAYEEGWGDGWRDGLADGAEQGEAE